MSFRTNTPTLLALLATLLLLTLTPPAHAGTYHHLSLNYAGFNNGDGWTAGANHQGRGYIAAVIAGDRAVAQWNIDGGRPAGFQSPEMTSFTYTAPADTTLKHAYWTNRINGLTSGPWQNVVIAGGRAVIDERPGAGNNMYLKSEDVTGSQIDFVLTCLGPASCYSSSNAGYQIDTSDMTLGDDFPPLAGSVSGPLKTASKLSGEETISFPANDKGAGLYRTLIFDGEQAVSKQVVNSNYGHCAEVGAPYLFDRQVPCLLSTTATATLETTALADGNHSIKVVLEDAAGNLTTVYGPATKLVANHPPVSLSAPVAADTAAFNHVAPGVLVRFQDAGRWSGPNLVVSTAWLRCDAAGAGCDQIPGAAGLLYTPGSEDIGHTLRLASTATNVAGSVTVSSAPSGVVVAPKSADGQTGVGETPAAAPIVQIPALGTFTAITSSTTTTTTTSHTLLGHVVGEPAGVACPGDRATLRFQHVKGGRVTLGYGRASTAQLELTCTTTGKAIAGAKLEIATKTGQQPAVAADVTTDGAGHATIRLAKGASRGIAVGYRMYSDDALARATATLKVYVKGRVSLKANHARLRNGRAVTLRGVVAGGHVPRRGVTLAVQWKDGHRWRPFAQIKTNRKGRFSYAYRFTRTTRRIRYQLRVQVTKGQVDYPFVASASKAVKVTVGP